MYQLNIENGYIVSLVKGVSQGNITESQYNHILAVLKTRPEAPDGFDHRLKTDLTWELYELPPYVPEDEPATEADYEAALADLGVTTDA